MDYNIYKVIPDWGLFSPSSLTSPKYTKRHPQNTVSCRDSVTYGVAKEVVGILQPIVGQPQHHIPNTQHIVEQNKDTTPGTWKYITS